MDHKPKTTQDAYANGQLCREKGHSRHYNPYRNMDHTTNDLDQAWVRGWEEADNRLKTVNTN